LNNFESIISRDPEQVLREHTCNYLQNFATQWHYPLVPTRARLEFFETLRDIGYIVKDDNSDCINIFLHPEFSFHQIPKNQIGLGFPNSKEFIGCAPYSLDAFRTQLMKIVTITREQPPEYVARLDAINFSSLLSKMQVNFTKKFNAWLESDLENVFWNGHLQRTDLFKESLRALPIQEYRNIFAKYREPYIDSEHSSSTPTISTSDYRKIDQMQSLFFSDYFARMIKLKGYALVDDSLPRFIDLRERLRSSPLNAVKPNTSAEESMPLAFVNDEL